MLQQYVEAFNFVTMVMVYKSIYLYPIAMAMDNINSGNKFPCKEEGNVATVCCGFQFCYHGNTAQIYLYPITMATGY